MPTKKPRGQELTLEQELANQALHHRRLRIEHVNSSVKRHRSWRRPRMGPPREVSVLERSLLLLKGYATLSPVSVTLVTTTDKFIWFLRCQTDLATCQWTHVESPISPPFIQLLRPRE